MKCKTMTIGGVTAIVCGTPTQKRCKKCGRPSTKLCDFPTGPGKTCDKPLCNHCAVPIDPETDHCPDHPRSDLLL